MLLTKHGAELCALLVDDVYGELPSRIITTLLNKGKATVQQLSQSTSLTPHQLRHGLAVLVQQNLLHFREDPATKVTVYEANPDAAYSLIRSGKIVEMVGSLYGKPEQEVFQTLLLSGHMRISDLAASFEDKIAAQQEHPKPNGGSVGHPTVNGNSRASHSDSTTQITSSNHLNSTLVHLFAADLVEVMHKRTFQCFDDTRVEAEEDVLKRYFPGGLKGVKAKLEFASRTVHRINEVLDEGKSVKRKLEQNTSAYAKRRRLMNGARANGWMTGQGDPMLDPKTVVRVNYEKCLVELRNQWLIRMASETIGETTAQVYGALLRLLSLETSRCRIDPRLDLLYGGDDYNTKRFPVHPSLSASEILDALDPAIDLFTGIGKASSPKIDVRISEHIQRQPALRYPLNPDAQEEWTDGMKDEDSGDDLLDDGGSDEEVESVPLHKGKSLASASSGTAKGTKVKFQEAGHSRANRQGQLREHLLLLADSNLGFVRHSDSNGWTVDFEPLIEKLQEVELETLIEQTCGRYGLRLARILKEKGKLDDKALLGLALMTKRDLHQTMTHLEVSGFLEIQEIPKDNNRSAARTLFLWFFDKDRNLSQMLDKLYKSMVRCLQTLEIQRQKEKNILSFVERSDIKGKEEDVMAPEAYNQYMKHLALQSKLLGQVMRLDDLVAAIRDY